MLTAVGVLVFAVALLLSVMLHEAGHFLTARRFGMKATQFFVGFGPTLWSRHKGETEYGVKALPLGGFVKIVGMTPLEEVEPGDEDRAFYKQPAGRKTIVLAAGSTVHFIICVLLVVGLTAFYGTQVEKPPVLRGISTCLADDPDAKCEDPGSIPGPAKEAGLEPGDTVVAVNGDEVTDAEGLTDVIRASADKEIVLTVRRGERTVQVPVTPRSVVRADEEGTRRSVGAIGVSVQGQYEQQRDGVVGTLANSGRMLGTIVTGTIETFTEKLGTITKVYSEDRDKNGFIGIYGAGHISGEIAAAEAPIGDKAASLVLMLAALNLFIGVFNLLPLLPLDGGHIAVLLFEQARDRVRRMRGYRGEIQRVDMNKLLPLTFAVVILFAGFTLYLLGADIVNPITLD